MSDIKVSINYYLLDSACIFDALDRAMKLQPDFLNLFNEKSEQQLNSVAPYLFSYQNNSLFAKWVFENGWGNSWGVLFNAVLPKSNLQKHFRKLLLITTEKGEELYFRFYDPRVLKIFLPTCDQNQILEFFGPIESFICEGETKDEAIRFWHQNGTLMQEVLTVEQVFGKTIQNVEI